MLDLDLRSMVLGGQDRIPKDPKFQDPIPAPNAKPPNILTPKYKPWHSNSNSNGDRVLDAGSWMQGDRFWL